MVDGVAEGALQNQAFAGESKGGFEDMGVFVSQRVKSGGGLLSMVRTCVMQHVRL